MGGILGCIIRSFDHGSSMADGLKYGSQSWEDL